MPTFTLGPNEHERIKFQVPKDHWVEFNVEADRPVDVWIVDREGLRQFYEVEKTIECYYRRLRSKQHHEEIELPFRGSWWLLIVNRDEEHSVAVHYDVFW